MNYHEELNHIGSRAKSAFRQLAVMSSDAKNHCLATIAKHLELNKDEIIKQNQIDLRNGEKNGLSAALLDRLKLSEQRFQAMTRGLEDVARLHDPVGRIDREFKLPNDLVVKKVRVPIGVIGIIYESRPNVTVDAAALCLKAGNAVILRGGSEAFHTNSALAVTMANGLSDAGAPEAAAQLIPWTDREAVSEMLRMHDRIDLIIPRGGEGLIRFVAENSTIPVIKHYKGVCHVYIDKDADDEMAISIVENAKCQRPGVCNALETLLIHESKVPSLLTPLCERLIARNVELRGDETVRRVVPSAKAASEDDWYAEYLDTILAIRVVPSIDAAIDHIAVYGSAHSDAIVSSSPEACERFLAEVDSAAVYANASTRFTDGGQFGMGAEIGISTDKIHARGPMGVDELTSYKYQVIGTGQIREN